MYGRKFILYSHEVEPVRAFANHCGADLLIFDDASRCAQFVGAEDAFTEIGSFLTLPTDLIDDGLRLMLKRQDAGAPIWDAEPDQMAADAAGQHGR